MLHVITRLAAVDPARFTVDCYFDQDPAPRRVALADLVAELAQAPPLAELAEPSYFRRVHLNEYGTLAWPNEVDFCPDVLYRRSEPVAD